jgi:hypothetical protein
MPAPVFRRRFLTGGDHRGGRRVDNARREEGGARRWLWHDSALRTAGAPEYGTSVPSAASAATWQFIARMRGKAMAEPHLIAPALKRRTADGAEAPYSGASGTMRQRAVSQQPTFGDCTHGGEALHPVARKAKAGWENGGPASRSGAAIGRPCMGDLGPMGSDGGQEKGFCRSLSKGGEIMVDSCR